MQIPLSEALKRAQLLCSKAEKCRFDLSMKFRQWGLSADEADELFLELEKEGFLDEARYAKAFVNDRIRMGKWGKIKIKAALSQKHIPSSLIREALSQIDETLYREMILGEMHKKTRTQHPGTPGNRDKLFRFGLSRGYEPEILQSWLSSLPPHSEKSFLED